MGDTSGTRKELLDGNRLKGGGTGIAKGVDDLKGLVGEVSGREPFPIGESRVNSV